MSRVHLWGTFSLPLRVESDTKPHHRTVAPSTAIVAATPRIVAQAASLPSAHVPLPPLLLLPPLLPRHVRRNWSPSTSPLRRRRRHRRLRQGAHATSGKKVSVRVDRRDIQAELRRDGGPCGRAGPRWILFYSILFCSSHDSCYHSPFPFPFPIERYNPLRSFLLIFPPPAVRQTCTAARNRHLLYRLLLRHSFRFGAPMHSLLSAPFFHSPFTLPFGFYVGVSYHIIALRRIMGHSIDLS